MMTTETVRMMKINISFPRKLVNMAGPDCCGNRVGRLVIRVEQYHKKLQPGGGAGLQQEEERGSGKQATLTS